MSNGYSDIELPSQRQNSCLSLHYRCTTHPDEGEHVRRREQRLWLRLRLIIEPHAPTVVVRPPVDGRVKRLLCARLKQVKRVMT